jgi:hypothetical protein
VGGGENGGAGEREDVGLGVGRPDEGEAGDKLVLEKKLGGRKRMGCGPAGDYASPHS